MREKTVHAGLSDSRSAALANLTLIVALAGCAGCAASAPLSTRPLEGEPTSGDEDAGEPLVLGAATLPALPASVHAEDEVVRTALDLAREAAAPPHPALSEEATSVDLTAYMSTEFHDWMLARARAIGTARTALREMEHGDTDEYVLASALVGALFAMLADEIATLPLPASVRDDPRQRVLVREALLETALPLYRRAIDAFGGCASSAVSSADPTLEAWATYCDAAIRAAEEAPRPVEPREPADHEDAPP